MVTKRPNPMYRDPMDASQDVNARMHAHIARTGRTRTESSASIIHSTYSFDALDAHARVHAEGCLDQLKKGTVSCKHTGK